MSLKSICLSLLLGTHVINFLGFSYTSPFPLLFGGVWFPLQAMYCFASSAAIIFTHYWWSCGVCSPKKLFLLVVLSQRCIMLHLGHGEALYCVAIPKSVMVNKNGFISHSISQCDSSLLNILAHLFWLCKLSVNQWQGSSPCWYQLMSQKLWHPCSGRDLHQNKGYILRYSLTLS